MWWMAAPRALKRSLRSALCSRQICCDGNAGGTRMYTGRRKREKWEMLSEKRVTRNFVYIPPAATTLYSLTRFFPFFHLWYKILLFLSKKEIVLLLEGFLVLFLSSMFLFSCVISTKRTTYCLTYGFLSYIAATCFDWCYSLYTCRPCYTDDWCPYRETARSQREMTEGAMQEEM